MDQKQRSIIEIYKKNKVIKKKQIRDIRFMLQLKKSRFNKKHLQNKCFSKDKRYKGMKI